MQYWRIKARFWDTVVFFKKGKFYELYEKDADIGIVNSKPVCSSAQNLVHLHQNEPLLKRTPNPHLPHTTPYRIPLSCSAYG